MVLFCVLLRFFPRGTLISNFIHGIFSLSVVSRKGKSRIWTVLFKTVFRELVSGRIIHNGGIALTLFAVLRVSRVCLSTSFDLCSRSVCE